MIAEWAFWLTIWSLAVMAALICLDIMADVLFSIGGETAESLIPPFLVVSSGFLLLGWPIAHGCGGTPLGVMLMAVVAVADIATALGFVLRIIDAVAGGRPRSAPIGTIYAQVASRGNASGGTGSGSCHGHAPAPAEASKADGRSSPGCRRDDTRARPDGSDEASSG